MSNVSKDDFVICPYDKSHRLLRNRLPVHLQRCRKNFPKGVMETCPYNITHVVNKCELELHISMCESRRNEIRKLEAINSLKPLSQHQTVVLPEVKCEANWDDEPDVPTYNPQEYCRANLIVRSIHGAPPSERRQFRNSERIRLMELNK